MMSDLMPFIEGTGIVMSPENIAQAMVLSTLQDIEEFEAKVNEAGMNIVDSINEVGMRDHFIPGMYCRVLSLPAGFLITGKIHKRPYIDVFISGRVTVKSYLADGSIEDTAELKDFTFLNGKEGRKRVLFVHEDSLWVTVDPTVATDITKAEDDIIFPTMDSYILKTKELT